MLTILKFSAMPLWRPVNHHGQLTRANSRIRSMYGWISILLQNQSPGPSLWMIAPTFDEFIWILSDGLPLLQISNDLNRTHDLIKETCGPENCWKEMRIMPCTG